uniref:Uncharacterized protein n=1 Tax=Tanacetum cinerariifolium TaxID=118510 RepID=A0A6L2LQ92_TANCI|nr:hypothetical protein [Tanacetum cinerariifolium]
MAFVFSSSNNSNSSNGVDTTEGVITANGVNTARSQAKKGQTKYALIAYSTSSASSLDSEVSDCSKSCLKAVKNRLEELFNEPKTEKLKDKSNNVEPKSVRKGSDAPIIKD